MRDDYDMQAALALLEIEGDCELMIDKMVELLRLPSRIRAFRDGKVTPNAFGGFGDDILQKAFDSKKNQIVKAKSRKELRLMMEPPKVRWGYRGKVEPAGEFVTPEEELMIWSETSLVGPLRHEGYERYMELFKQVFPYMAHEIGI